LYRKRLLRLVLILAVLTLTTTVLAQSSAQFDLGWHVLSAGGGKRSSSNYQLADALGQWAAGTSSKSSFKIEPGFMAGAVEGVQCYQLTLSHSGTGGDPSPSPAQSNSCAGARQYIAGESINLTASPEDGWIVASWSGTANDSSTANTNSLTMPASNHAVQVTYAPQPDAYEVDNTCGQSQAIDVNGAHQEHNFHIAADTDWVSFDVVQNTQYRVEVSTPISSAADVNLSVYPACDLAPTFSFEETFTPGVRLDFTAPSNGPVYLRLANFVPAIAGPEVSYRLSVRSLEPVAQKGAVILLAGRIKVNDPLQPNIHYVINTAYELFKQQGYTEDEIMYLAVDPALPGADKGATMANLQDAINNWAVNKVGPEKSLMIYMMDHGDIDQLFVDEVAQQHLSPQQLHTWLNQLEVSVPGVKVTVVIEACFSGSFIEGLQSVSHPGRTVISSTSANAVAFASATGAQFSDHFLAGLSQDIGICTSFLNAQDSVLQLSSIQQPWIDANGNKLPNEAADCEQASLQVPLAGSLPEDSWAPYIVQVEGPGQVVGGRGTISAQVRDNKAVARVWAVVYPPSYTAPSSSQELVPENLPVFELAAVGSEMFSAEYTHFNETGSYRIAIYARDESGLITGPVIITISVQQTHRQVYLPILHYGRR
jgi:hypothetical protein